AGLAALYAYESQIPGVCISKIAGLRHFYGFTKAEQWQYFSVHIAADTEHAATERELLKKNLRPADVQEVRSGVQEILDLLWDFLSSLCTKHHLTCQAA